MRKHWLLLAGVWLAVGLPAQAQNKVELPVAPAGFRVELFAREPLVRNPASMAFDAKGRLFVGQGPQFRHPKPDTPADSILILLDTDGDGLPDQTRTFATGFNCIQALAWKGNDLWVANSPDLTIVRDRDGDDQADEYVKVYSDLGNLEHALHGLNWGPDGKLYMSKGNSKGLNRPDHYAPLPFRQLWGLKPPAGAVDFPASQVFTKDTYRKAYHDPADDWGRQGGVLRCDDGGRNLEIVAAGMRNPWDITFDDGFNWLGTDNDQTEGDKIFMPFPGAHFGWGHAWSANWSGKDHLPTAPASGPLFEGSGTGIIYYQASQFPPPYRNAFFICDYLRHFVYIYRPRWEGALLQPAGGQLEEFLTRGKALFNPTDIEVGPDGALYVLGWGAQYGATWNKLGQQDNEGRIFRISFAANAPLKSDRPAKPYQDWTFAELAADLGHPVPVWRVNAQDELVRRGQAVKGELLQLLARRDLPGGQQTWAAWTLGRLADDPAIDKFFAGAAAQQQDLNLRIQAIRIMAHRIRESGQPRELPAVVVAALADDEPRVRFEAVLALRQARQKQHREALIGLAARETDRVTFYAAWKALLELAEPKELRPLLRSSARRAALLALAEVGKLQREEVQPLRFDEDLLTATAADLWLRQHGVRLPPLLAVEPPGGDFAESVSVTLKSGLEGATIHYTLDGTPPTAGSPRFSQAIEIDADATLTAVLVRDGKRIGPALTARYHRLTAEELRRRLIYELRVASKNRYQVVENGLALGARFYTDREYRLTQVPAQLAGSSYIMTANGDEGARGSDFLSFELTRDAAIYVAHDRRTQPPPAWLKVGQPDGFQDTQQTLATSDHVLQLFRKEHRAGKVTLGGNEAKSNYLVIVRRPPLVARSIKTAVQEVLPLVAQGDPARGRDIFFDAGGLQCFRCHRIGDQGQTLAPNLSDIGQRAMPEEIVQSILEPNAKITEGFRTFLIETAGGQVHTGSILSETGRELKLLLADGAIADLDKESIVERVVTERSIMPDNFGLYLAPQQVADLAAFLIACRQGLVQPAAASDKPEVSFAEKEGEIVLRVAGQPVASYVYRDPKIARPFLAHLKAPGGTQVSRNHPPIPGQDSTDHDTMHPGIWLGFGDIGGVDFWRNRGRVEHDKIVEAPKGGQGEGSFAVANRYLAGDKLICRQTCRYTVAVVPQGTLIVIDSTFSGDADFQFGSQEEMGLGVRLATPLTVKAGGRMLDAEGRVNEKEIWGKPADWCDYSGVVNGQRVGMAIFPGPANPQRSWFHARDYGVLVANPFGPRAGGPARLTVKQGESLRLRYGVLLHAAPEDSPVKIDEAYRDFKQRLGSR